MPIELIFDVKGMHCAGCEQNLAFALVELDGVVDVKADHQAETVTASVVDQSVDAEEILHAIEAMGYQVERSGGYRPGS